MLGFLVALGAQEKSIMTWFDGIPLLLWSFGGALALGGVSVYYYSKKCPPHLSRDRERSLHIALFLAALVMYIGLIITWILS